ncbi:MAG: C25 family cysteine peptidase [Bacteroidota bacterium]|nr:C25 family cysteine peptidase [Bacteroidota bacterium]
MKKFTFSLSALAIIFGITTSNAQTAINLVSTSAAGTTIEFIPGAVKFKEVVTADGKSQIVMVDKGTFLMEAGNPDLQKLSTSVIIPDQAEMEATIVSSSFYDLAGVKVAPSKGNLKRTINPSDIAFTKGSVYTENSFFPSAINSLNQPYILRDHRGQTISVCPFQYNPVTEVLRVYTNIVVKVAVKNAIGGENAFERIHTETLVDPEFDAIYKRQFINYTSTNREAMFTPVSENGSMLIICYDTFSGDMQPFVDWKNQKGIPTQMVLKSAIGTTAAQIKTYIANYYTSNPSLKYVLLVGDAPQIPASLTSWGDSDNDYGYLSGGDSYPELFIGRFSATTSTHVQIMVNRTINYEKTPQAGGTWYKKGITIASDQGPGDDSEMDFEHQRNLATQMLAYSYNNISENFDGSQGGLDLSGNPTATSIGTHINNGAGIITYTGHGSDFAFSTSGYSTTNITSLTNTVMHPFIWSVACVNGNFVSNTTCFAEGWLRAGTPSAPTGALATLMSTINQSWNPPMEGQDAMVNILVESAAGNIKRTFGGLSMNGCMQMNDVYGPAGAEMTDTWTLFGDPSVMVFTDTPLPMVTTHVAVTPLGTTSITVNCNTDGALICLSDNGVILGTGTASGGSAVITIPSAVAGVITVTATAYNKMPYSGTINVSGTVGINYNATENTIRVYPNPASTNLTVMFNSSTEKMKIALYNYMGQEVIMVSNENGVSGSFTKTIDVSSLTAGAYLLKIEQGNTVSTEHIVINR